MPGTGRRQVTADVLQAIKKVLQKDIYSFENVMLGQLFKGL